MAGKFRAWANNLSADVKRDVAQTLSQEASYARDDIRQKLIEEGWTGSVQTPRLHKTYTPEGSPEPETKPDEGLDIQGNPIEGEDFSETVWDNEQGIGIEAPEIETPEIKRAEIEPE
ncbi:hypothetical protein [Thalassococcus sp. S3]|uniref:hypothetical protein n=1 Tax=Thalassococcus sp. S3 TaxID=2017482 RepID=UPI0010246F4B|nr:hypothetical protein [Thalassococcus sp. S3]QBF30060.1 hypothetical protein CFI11_02335 [Thalassococcus sp. S3]